jgi:hypothetical protein
MYVPLHRATAAGAAVALAAAQSGWLVELDLVDLPEAAWAREVRWRSSDRPSAQDRPAVACCSSGGNRRAAQGRGGRCRRWSGMEARGAYCTTVTPRLRESPYVSNDSKLRHAGAQQCGQSGRPCRSESLISVRCAERRWPTFATPPVKGRPPRVEEWSAQRRRRMDLRLRWPSLQAGA